MSDESRPAKVVGYPDKAGEYRWRLVGGNGENEASGQGYETKEHVQEGVDRVGRNFADVIGVLQEGELKPEAYTVPIQWVTTKEAMEMEMPV